MLRCPQDFQNLRVNGRFTPRYLQKIRLTLAGYKRVHHPLDLGKRPVKRPLRRRVGEADGAGKVAGFVDVDEGQA